jgi:methyl-accepting chemotaxis protein
VNNLPLPQSSDNYVLAEQVRILFANTKTSNISLFIVAPVMAVVLWGLIPHNIFLSWLVFAFTVAMTWLFLAKRYQEDIDREGNLPSWYRLGLGAAIGIGLVWVLVPFLFLPPLSGDERTFVIMIIVGRSVASIATFSAIMPAIWLSVIPTLLALILVLLWQFSVASAWLALLTGLFVLLTIRTAKTLNQTIVSSTLLHFSLRSEKEKADHLNANLLRKITDRQLAEEQLRSGIQILTESTSQIMRSLTQLLTSTSQTATAVTQTVTTIEEVKQTAHIAGQKAKDVSADAQHAAAIAQTGEHATDAALSGLQQANQQIESIAHSVIKLGEHSHAIGMIVDSVNELAEQSNLLAVNAAIEAAKAGEHGKGFAVVAHEVKNLAQQSKRATAQVKDILQEIQRAARDAVMVTEQGTQAIETGVSRSIEAHQSIKELSQSVTRSAQSVTQIALSSQEQLVGMDQVAQAMVSVKQAATQNVDGMRQIEKAAQRLHEVGQTLKGFVTHETQDSAHSGGEQEVSAAA